MDEIADRAVSVEQAGSFLGAGFEIDAAIVQSSEYFRLLNEWNKRLNLIKTGDWANFFERHILDSVSPVKWGLIGAEASLCDIGTGGGLPGIPLKIFLPRIRLVMVESIQKKVKAVREIVDSLGLSGVEVVRGRAEEICERRDYRGRFDVVTARAIGDRGLIKSSAARLLRDGGTCIIYKTCEMGSEGETNAGGGVSSYRYSFPGLIKDRMLEITEKSICST